MKLVLLAFLLLFAGAVFSQTELDSPEDDLEMLATKLNEDDVFVEMTDETDGFDFGESQNDEYDKNVGDDKGITQSVSGTFHHYESKSYNINYKFIP